MRLVAPLIRRKAGFVYPILPAPRTAVLVPWFCARGSIRVFNAGWNAEAAAYLPEAIAAPWAQMESLLAIKIESLTHALIVLARPADELLTVEQRQQLWRAFRVPIFEQVIGEHGVLLAAECEAHAGLHIESPRFDAGSREIENALCGCGRQTPRLKTVGQLKAVEQMKDVRSAAAYAR